MIVSGMWLVLCPLKFQEEEKKREEEARRRKSEGSVEEKSATGPHHDFAARTGRRRYCQFQELPQNGPRYIY